MKVKCSSANPSFVELPINSTLAIISGQNVVLSYQNGTSSTQNNLVVLNGISSLYRINFRCGIGSGNHFLLLRKVDVDCYFFFSKASGVGNYPFR
jgi:hypothetical protein